MTFRDDRFEALRAPLRWTAAAALLVAVVIAGGLLLGDRSEVQGSADTVAPVGYGGARAAFDTGAAPIGATLTAPVRWTGDVFGYVRGYFGAVSENRRLRARLIELERWRYTAAALQDVNQRYEALLKLRTEPPIPMTAARIVTDARGPYKMAQLADAGVQQGVRIGNPVLGERGLLGRVVGVTRRASRVLLLTDVASRTPVMVDRTNARAILSGDGGPNPKMAFIRGVEPVRAGDVITTSGDGGVFPRGLPVGEAVKGLDGVWRVRLYADRAPMDFVQILQFRDFTEEVDEAELARTQMPPAPKLPQPPAPAAPPVAVAPRPATAATPRPTSPPVIVPRPAAPVPTPTPAPAVEPALPAAEPTPEPAPAAPA